MGNDFVWNVDSICPLGVFRVQRARFIYFSCFSNRRKINNFNFIEEINKKSAYFNIMKSEKKIL